ncbi:MAG: methionine synthase, partial [Proteobacteria bacterium]|nr:methionine synthase [Pseudomonadota bacterium]
GIGAREKIAEFIAAHDDYSAITFEALADRLAEACAEWLHHRVRTDLWGFVPDERFSKEEMIDEKYQGIRPAPGYPACPDHRIKQPLFALLGAADVGMQVTESFAMQPGASVSGFYFSHPASTYFNVGPIDDSQAEDMAARSGVDAAAVKRALGPNLGL